MSCHLQRPKFTKISSRWLYFKFVNGKFSCICAGIKLVTTNIMALLTEMVIGRVIHKVELYTKVNRIQSGYFLRYYYPLADVILTPLSPNNKATASSSLQIVKVMPPKIWTCSEFSVGGVQRLLFFRLCAEVKSRARQVAAGVQFLWSFQGLHLSCPRIFIYMWLLVLLL